MSMSGRVRALPVWSQLHRSNRELERQSEREREREAHAISMRHTFATNRLLSRASRLSRLSRRVQESTKEDLMTRLTRGFVPPTSLLFTSQLPSSSARYPSSSPWNTNILLLLLSLSLSLSLAVRRYSKGIANFFHAPGEWTSLPLNDFNDISRRKVGSGWPRPVRAISVGSSGH